MDLPLIVSTIKTLQIDEKTKLILLDASALTQAHTLPAPPDVDMVITGISSFELASNIRTVLLSSYPSTHGVKFVYGNRILESTIDSLNSLSAFSNETCLHVPPLEIGMSFESFQEIVAHLRAPDGCPWDREQTHLSLRTHLLEETYEALAAIDAEDIEGMREELGDLLLQIVLHSQIAHETGEFSVNEVIKSIHDKIVRRHPHVFGNLELDDVGGVLQNWEKLKETERKEKGKDNEKGLLDGVSITMPALSQAQEYQDRAARVGFDWSEIDGVLEKIREEIEEVKQSENLKELSAELGDLMFALVNLARWKNIDAESALREMNLRFKGRFGYVERVAKEQGKSLSDLSLDELELLWQESKLKEI